MKLLVVTCLLAISLPAWAQPKPANKITKDDLVLAFNQDFHAVDSALVETCSTQFPELAKPIASVWNEALTKLPPELVQYRRTAEFRKTVRQYKQEQAAQAKTPEGKQALDNLCHAMANGAPQ